MPDVCLMKNSAVPLSDEEEEEEERGMKGGRRAKLEIRGIRTELDDKQEEELQRRRCEDGNEPPHQRISRKELKGLRCWLC